MQPSPTERGQGLNIDSLWLDSAEDMLAILFPHLVEDLEFLVPPEDDVTMDEAFVTDVADGMSQMRMNAEAGPSRLR